MKKAIAVLVGHGPARDSGAESADTKVAEIGWNRALARAYWRELTKFARE